MANTAPMLVVAGNIATGKTHLVEALGEALKLRPFLERWEENPWFDEDPRDAFASQIWFLLAAGADHQRMTVGGGVQERCIHEHAQVFARELLTDGDAQVLADTYLRLDDLLPNPTLLVYLKASVQELSERIRQRGRVQEQALTSMHLENLQSRYETLITDWTRCSVLEIDTEAIDLRTPEGLRHVFDRTSELLS